MNKKIAITIITLLCLVIIGLVICLGLLIKKDFKFKKIHINTNKPVSLIEEKEFDSINNLYIKTNTSDIYINKSDSDKVKIKLYSDYYNNSSINNTDNMLNVLLTEKNRFFSFFNKSGKIIIYLPETYDKVIKINTDTSDIKIDDFINASANIEVDTGDINIKRIDKLSTDSDTGDVIVSHVNDLKTDSDTGDIRINNIYNSCDIETDTGNININNLNILANSSIKSDTGDVNIKNSNEIWIDTKTDTGNVKIKNNFRKSDIELKIKTETGNIKVGY